MAQKQLSDDELEKLLLQKIAEGLKNGTLSREIMVGNVKKIATPEEYFKKEYDTIKSGYISINRHAILWQMAQSPRLKIPNVVGLSQAQASASGNYTALKDIQKGMNNLNIKAKITSAEYITGASNTGTGNYRLLNLTLQDHTGTLPASIFWTALRQQIFDAYDDGSLVGKTFIGSGMFFDNKKPQYPPKLGVATTGTFELSDEDLGVIEKITPIAELNQASTKVNIRGRIFLRSPFTTKEQKSACSLVLYDGTGSISCQAWEDVVDQIPENNTVILLRNVTYQHENAYRKNKGFDPRLISIAKDSITIIDDDHTIPTEIPKTDSLNSSDVRNTFADLTSAQDTFDGIVYVDHFISTKYDQNAGKQPKEPWYLVCNQHPTIQYPKWIKEQADHTLWCPMCEKQVQIGNTDKHLLISATITDGTMWYPTTIMDEHAEKIFGMSPAEVIKQYIQAGHEKFFTLENARSGGKAYHCKGKLQVDSFGAKFKILEIEPSSLEDAFQFEAEHFQPAQ